MTKNYFYFTAILALCVIVFTSCERDDEPAGGRMTMTTAKSDVIFTVPDRKIIVNWGDRNRNVINAGRKTEAGNMYRHRFHFPNTAVRTVSIFGDISQLDGSGMELTHIDVSQNRALLNLNCMNNQLSSLDVRSNPVLVVLNCSNNQLTNLDVSNNPFLRFLYCNHNKLTHLDVRNNLGLLTLSCSNNQLTNLNVSNNTGLMTLNCSNNLLTDLDMSNNSALRNLNVSYNQLTNLDISHNTLMRYLKASNNQLTSLDVSKHTGLHILDISNNQFTADALNALFESLNSFAPWRRIYIGGNPGAADSNRDIARRKGWTVLDFRDGL